ncbi:MAG: hypothetical protein Q8P24_16665, partial [Desulfobacterales bacterium]|nr:hypothetical protein [Desulfobacterales bacterium]
AAAGLPAAQAQEKERTKAVTVIGTGAIYRNNTAGGRDAAIANGLVAAVDAAVLEMAPEESLSQNFGKLNDAISGHTGAFILNYKVLAEYVSDRTYRVAVQANVSLSRLEERLSAAGFTPGKKTLPRILFLIAESNLNEESPRYWWGKEKLFATPYSETAMATAMREKLFITISPDLTAQISEDETKSYPPDLSDADAVVLGRRFQAEVVVVGRAVSSQATNIMGGNIKSFQGAVTARALRTDTGLMLGSTVQAAAATGADEIVGSRTALSGAGTLAGQFLSRQIAAAWLEKAQNPREIILMVEGTRQLGNFVMFRKVLNDMPDIKNLKLLEMKSDEASIALDFPGSPKDLADALMLKNFGAFGINIYEVLEDRLKVRLVQTR